MGRSFVSTAKGISFSGSESLKNYSPGGRPPFACRGRQHYVSVCLFDEERCAGAPNAVNTPQTLRTGIGTAQMIA